MRFVGIAGTFSTWAVMIVTDCRLVAYCQFDDVAGGTSLDAVDGLEAKLRGGAQSTNAGFFGRDVRCSSPQRGTRIVLPAKNSLDLTPTSQEVLGERIRRLHDVDENGVTELGVSALGHRRAGVEPGA